MFTAYSEWRTEIFEEVVVLQRTMKVLADVFEIVRSEAKGAKCHVVLEVARREKMEVALGWATETSQTIMNELLGSKFLFLVDFL
jgi:ribosomal protein S7